MGNPKKNRSKKKLFIWLGSILGALIIIIGAGGYFAINFAADKVLDSMMQEALAPTDQGMASPSSPQNKSNNEGSSDNGVEVTIEPSASPSGVNASSSKTPVKSGDLKSSSDSSQSTTPSKSPIPSPSPSPSYQAEISTEKAEAVKENITFSEKTKVLTVMLKRLNADDIKTLQKLANGGLTRDQKKEAKAIILQKLTEDEYNDLIDIAKKYGLSQGKSYEDSQKEDLSK